MSFDPSLPDDGFNVSRTHPLREALTLIVGVLVVAAGVAFAIGLAVDLVAPYIPPAVEVRLFGGWFGGDSPGTEDAQERERALAELLERVARHWPANPYAFEILIWDQSDPNALALPGGTIAITTGLLDAVESENELAFVLGHELGHFRNRDHLRGLGRGVGFSLALAAVGLSAGGGAAQLASVAGELTQRGFGRDQEQAADRFGLQLVAAEYGHTAGATDLFDHIPSPVEGLAGDLTGYLSTHPLHADRVHLLDDMARRAGWPLRGERTALPAELDERGESDEPAP